MRVLIIHTRYKLQGGEDGVVSNEVELLRQNHHTVSLLEFQNASGTLLNLCFLPFNPMAYNRTLKSIKTFNPDIIHIHNLHFAGSAAVIYAAKHLGVPMVMTIHNFRLLCPSGSLYFKNKMFLDSLHQTFPFSAIKKGVYQNSKPITFWLALSNYIHRRLRTWSNIHTLIFLGDYSKQIFIDAKLISGETQMIVKPNFTQPTNTSRREGKENYFLFVGRLSEEKGINTLLKAFEEMGENLKVVGTGPLKQKVMEKIGKSTNIQYLDHLDKASVTKIMMNAKAIIFPSEWFETFGMVMIEAFALGKPVIAADLGNVPTIVKNEINGLTFEAGNADALIKTVKKYENFSPVKKTRMSEAAFASFLKNYSPEINLKQLEKIYLDAIANRT